MILLDLPLWIVLVFLFALGAVLGSFLNVCIYRIPRHERLLDQLRGLWSPPSCCPRCGARIRITDNVPILGWLKLRGRCRNCRMRISPRYPLIELFNGLLFVAVYWLHVPADYTATIAESSGYAPVGPQLLGIWSDAAWLHWRYLYHMVLIEALVVATFIDFDEMIIPDGATLPAMGLGILGGWGLGQVFLVPVWFENPEFVAHAPAWMRGWTGDLVAPFQYADPFARPAETLLVPRWIFDHPHLHGLAVSLAGLLVGGGMIWGVRIIGGWMLRQEAMGFGDVILMALIGSFLGWQPAVVAFFIAPFCAVAAVGVRRLFRREREFPYGPYLSLAAVITMLGWREIWPAVQQFFALGPLAPAILLSMAVLLAAGLQVVQLGKRMLGIPLYPPDEEWIEEWTSADQLVHVSGETVDPQQGQWRTDAQWPGKAAGRGQLHEERWRRGLD